MVVVDEITVEKTARDLLKATWAPELDAGECQLPVDPFYIAGRLSLRVTSSRFDIDASSMLAKDAGVDADLYVNAGDTPNRQRFSGARELGHFVMRATGDPADTWGHISWRGPDAPRGVDLAEGRATRFAAELLMPEPIVRPLLLELTVPALAVRFEVPLDVMTWRIARLRSG